MNCGSKTIKYLLFFFNLVFVLCGITLICFGVAIKSFYRDYETLLDDRFFSAPSLLITSGTIIFFIAFFGCCGAVKENHCMVLTFGILLGAIFVMELVAGVTGYVLSEDTYDVLSGQMKKSMSFYHNSTDNQKLWDTLQKNAHCCGTNNYTDWFDVSNTTDSDLPMSCCPVGYGVIGLSTCSVKTDNFYKKACLPILAASISDYAWSLGALATTIAFIQTVGIVFACYLAKSISTSAYESV